jgi:hypothetical protein
MGVYQMLYILILSVVLNVGQFINSRIDIKGHGDIKASQNTSVGYLVEYCDEALLNKSRATDINLKEYGIPENGLLSLEGRICQNYDIVAHDEWNFYYFNVEGVHPYLVIFDQDFVEQNLIRLSE